MKNNEFDENEFLSKSKQDVIKILKNEKVVIYGGGKVGKYIINNLKEHGINIQFIWDINAKNLKRDDGIPINYPDFRYKDKEIFIIYSLVDDGKSLYEDLKSKCISNGFRKFISCSSPAISNLACLMMNNNSYDTKICNKCSIRNNCKKYFDYLKAIQGDSKGLTFKRMTVMLTTRCSLNCENCVQCVPMYNDNKKHLDVKYEEFIDALKKFLHAISYIHIVEVIGGEAFLCKELKKILQEMIYIRKIGIINIITNSTIIPKNDVLEVLKNDKIVITADMYGDNLNKEINEKCSEFINVLQKKNINYFILDNNNSTWYKLGDFNKRNRKKNELINVYSKCKINECFIITPNGKFTICGRNFYGYNLGYLEDDSKDCIDINKIEIDDIYEKVRNLLKVKFLYGCNYCNGICNDNLVKSGVQVKRL